MVNDHSSDGSEGICENFASVDERFRLLQSPHFGMIGALNFGLSHAGGVYIARMGGDQLCEADRFAQQIKFLTQNPDIAFLGSFVKLLDEQDKFVRSREFPEDDFEIKAQLDKGETAFAPASMMVRRSALVELGGYREIFSSCYDFDLMLRAQDRYSLATLPEYLLSCRENYDKRELNERFWKHFYVARLAAISVEQLRAGLRDPVEQMTDEFDVEAIDERLVRERLTSARQDYYCNKRAFVDHGPLNSMDIEQIRDFLLTHKNKFNKKALGNAFALLFDQAIRIDDTESAEVLYNLQREVSKSRHLKSLLLKPDKLVRYALRKRQAQH